MSAVMTDSLDWESDEAYDAESDEAYDGEDYGEDFGEATGRSRRGRGRRGDYRLRSGVKGLSLRNQDGQTRTVPFPKKLATVEETNKGLANQEAARRALDDRLERLEAKFRNMQKRDGAVTGAVTLAIGLPLTGIGVYQVEHAATSTSGSSTTGTTPSFLSRWAHKDVTGIAAVTSATQLFTTVAKLAVNRRYHHSGIGIAADIFSAVQLTTYAFGRLSSTSNGSNPSTSAQIVAATQGAAPLQLAAPLQIAAPAVTINSTTTTVQKSP